MLSDSFKLNRGHRASSCAGIDPWLRVDDDNAHQSSLFPYTVRCNVARVDWQFRNSTLSGLTNGLGYDKEGMILRLNLGASGGHISNFDISNRFKDIVHSWIVRLVASSDIVVVICATDIQSSSLQ